jgi:hypothetical protein
LTKKNTLRNNLYNPALDEQSKLNVAVAVGMNGFDEKISVLYDL